GGARAPPRSGGAGTPPAIPITIPTVNNALDGCGSHAFRMGPQSNIAGPIFRVTVIEWCFRTNFRNQILGIRSDMHIKGRTHSNLLRAAERTSAVTEDGQPNFVTTPHLMVGSSPYALAS